MKKAPLAASLPSDVLCIIAQALLTSPFLSPPSEVHALIRWSHVCRCWRNGLLSNPLLWTKIDIPRQKIPLVKMMLTRSADSPLQIVVHPDFLELVVPYYKIVFAQIHRIESLDVAEAGLNPWFKNSDFIFHPFLSYTQALPMLKRFQWTRAVRADFYLEVPSGLFRQAPNFEDLNLSSSIISYQMPIFKSVTRLSLCDVKGITLVKLLHILRTASANLKVLNLSYLTELPPAANCRRKPNDPLIRLSSLQSLYLADIELSNLIAILDHITIPSDATWKISCDETLNRPDLDITPLYSFMESAPTGTHLYIASSGCPGSMLISFGDGSSGPHSELTLSEFDDHMLDQLKVLLSNFEFSQVSCCTINITQDPESEFSFETDIFGPLSIRLNNLRTLSVICREYSTGSFPLLDQLRPTKTLPFPLLNDLTIRMDHLEDEDWIQDVLESRHEAGHVLTNLCVVAELGPKVDKTVFEKFAKNVTVTCKLPYSRIF